MNKITEELLLGEIEDILWLDDSSSIIFFQPDKTGRIYTKKPDSDEGSEFLFTWKINDNGVLAINFENTKEKIIFWKLIDYSEDDNSIKLQVQEYEKIDNSKKPKKTQIKKLSSQPSSNLEERVQESNIEVLKSLVSDYNVWNYSIIGSMFFVFFIFIYILINFIVIIKDFPFLFQLFLILIITIFSFRPIFFITNKISYKVRYWIEKN